MIGFTRKITVYLALVVVFIITAGTIGSACDINFRIIDNKKSTYKAGEEFIIKVEVLLTHRNCPEGIRSTKFKTDGLKVVGKTKWIEKSTDVWERKLKLEVTNTKGKCNISADRKCDKEGGHGTLTIKAR